MKTWVTLLVLGMAALAMAEEELSDEDIQGIEENLELLENFELMDLFNNYEEISLMEILEDLEE